MVCIRQTPLPTTALAASLSFSDGQGYTPVHPDVSFSTPGHNIHIQYPVKADIECHLGQPDSGPYLDRCGILAANTSATESITAFDNNRNLDSAAARGWFVQTVCMDELLSAVAFCRDGGSENRARSSARPEYYTLLFS